MKTLNVGLLGTGFMGKMHTYCYSSLPFYFEKAPFKVNLKGVYSRTLKNAENFKNLHSFEYATDNWMDIINDPDIDIIDICTPNMMHYDQIMAAIKAGKHIYCEKPLTAHLSQAVDAAQAADKSDKQYGTVFHNRFFPAALRAKELIDEGALGNILAFRVSYLHSGSVDPKKPVGWKQQSEGAGVLYDLGSHALDLLCHLAGKAQSITCKTQTLYPYRPDKEGNMIKMTADDAAYMILTLQNGAVGTCEVSKVATGANDEFTVEIHGDKGAVKLNLMSSEWLYFYDNTLPDLALGGNKGYTRIECVGRYPAPASSFPGPKFSVGWARAHVQSVFSFVNSVFENKKPSPSFDDGAYIQALIEKAYESAENGTVIALT